MVRASSLGIGKALGPDYRLTQFRGRGSFGSVWEAIDADGNKVALKLLPCTSRLTAAQEIRAIQSINQLRHPNLTPIEQVWCYHNYVVINMKLADGSLLDLLEAYQTEYKTAVPAEELVPLIKQAAAALDFLNARQHYIDGAQVGVQHCDVKPSNFLLYGDTLKLCDFSLASLLTSSLRPHRRAGTADYMAPEVFRGQLSDHTDQYALAVTYCQLRGGRLPFPAVTGSLNPNFVRPAPDLSMLSPPEKPIIARGLAASALDRWPSCGMMVEQLGRLLEKSSQPAR